MAATKTERLVGSTEPSKKLKARLLDEEEVEALEEEGRNDDDR